MSTEKSSHTESQSPLSRRGLGEANPLLQLFTGVYETAPFSSIKIEHYLPAFDAAIEEARGEIQEIIDNPETPTFENTIVALDLAGDRLNRIQNIFFNLNSAETCD